jgi:hypothetical protein
MSTHEKESSKRAMEKGLHRVDGNEISDEATQIIEIIQDDQAKDGPLIQVTKNILKGSGLQVTSNQKLNLKDLLGPRLQLNAMPGRTYTRTDSGFSESSPSVSSSHVR